jgi:hypothetical protein
MTASSATSSNTSSIVAVVAELSRSCKYNNHILVGGARNNNNKKKTSRKRQRNDEQQQQHDSSPSSPPSSSPPSPSPLVNNNNSCCFEVRPSSSSKNNQNGMFATHNIACGDLIIAHEDPIVSSTERLSSSPQKSTSSSTSFCHGCSTPIGSLKDHILSVVNNNNNGKTTTTTTTTEEMLLDLPDLPCGLLKNEHGPIFSPSSTSSTSQSYRCSIEGCGCEQNVVWCSSQCRDKTTGNGGNQQQHAFDYYVSTTSTSTSTSTTEQNNAINNFYKGVTHPMAFQMAAKSITLILSTIMNKYIDDKSNITNENETTTKTAIDNDDAEDSDPSLDDLRQYYWWKDYGSHPLWWEVGSKSQSKQRKEQTNKFCHLFESHLLKSIEQPRFASSLFLDNGNNGKGSNCKNNKVEDKILVQLEELLRTAVKSLCTIDHIGSILGMFQCNAMGFKYLSPVQQYMEHVERKLDDMPDDDDDDNDNDDNDNNETALFYAGFDWLADHNVHNSEMNGPVIGSGLYPLLTLANHDCTPNASIEFLQESNRGSMVALRDIVAGEEICLSYIPSNEDDEEEENDNTNIQITKHFKRTRTEIWLEKQNKKVEGGGPSTQLQQQHEEEVVVVNQDSPSVEAEGFPSNSTTGSDGGSDDDGDGEDKDILFFDDESSTAKADRAKAIQEYGFECHCQRCQQQE